MRNAKAIALAAILAAVCQVAQAQSNGQRPRDQIRPEQLRIAVQEICPVSGRQLSSHGKPVEVVVGRERVFLCCRGCLSREVNASYWERIHANFASAQAKCPIMGKPLPKAPKWTRVEGRIVYVCCPACIRKVQADPKRYLAQINQSYFAALQAAQRSQQANPR